MNIESQIESLLFVSGSPLSSEKISKVLGVGKKEVEKAVIELKNNLEKAERGLEIAVIENKYQLVTSRKNTKIIEGFLKTEVIGELTKPQLETLTIIAYRGPISKIELEQIRGVNCSLILRNLMIRGLVEGSASLEQAADYRITHEFLKYLGISDVSELPNFEELSKNKNIQDLLDRTKEE